MTERAAPGVAPDGRSVPAAADETAGRPPAAPTKPGPGFGPPAAAGEVGTLGPYRVVRPLGRGGMGAVYAAVDTRLNRRVALKVMLPEVAADPAARGRFLREARAAAGITHDNVVAIFEADERGGVPYIAMQFLEGHPLDEFLKKGPPPVPEVLRIAREAAEGLAAAHAAGLVHRDIKPANLWLEAPRGRVKILDFGLVRGAETDTQLTKYGAMLGTPAYMSLEQALGERVDARTDLFSLGAVLYRLTTGRTPFPGDTPSAVVVALATQEPTPVRGLNPAVPGPLADLIHQLLARKPADRPASAEEVVRRVEAIAAGPPAPSAAPDEESDLPEALPDGPDGAGPDPAGSGRRWRRAAAGVAAGRALAAGVVVVTQGGQPGPGVATGGGAGPHDAGVGPTDDGGAGVSPAPRPGQEVDPPPRPVTDGKPPVAAADPDPDRTAAVWVLSLRGTVRVNGVTRG